MAVDSEERERFLSPVKLDPGWEGMDRPVDELNFRRHDPLDELERTTPRDRWNLVYIILLIHGIGVLMPWNMFITAKSVSCHALCIFFSAKCVFLN